ncbi:MAG: hypothetical protein NZ108_03610, partial [Bacteroidia bacterium]|nr:hypothetical protein [Bacteroidia bacterium]
ALSLGMNIFLFANRTNPEPSKSIAEEKHAKNSEKEEEIELAVLMSYNQRFAEKLFFAGQANNWELADFYVEELSENAEKIISHRIIDDGVDISELTKGMLLPAIQKLQESVKAKNQSQFFRDYKSLIISCNGCHSAAKHGFIVIQEPQKPSQDNQSFQVR